MPPFIPVSNTSVNLQDAFTLGVVDTSWKALENGPSLHEVVFAFQGGRKQGMIDSLVLDMSEVGKIYVKPMFNGHPGEPRRFKIFDAMAGPLSADPECVTMRYVVADKANAHGVGQQQRGLEILDDENLAQLVNVAHLMLAQRMLVVLQGLAGA